MSDLLVHPVIDDVGGRAVGEQHAVAVLGEDVARRECRPADRVLADAVDVHKNLRGWQRLIGYVPQTIFLMDDTLRRNVAFGLADSEIDDQAVMRAIRAAQLDEFVASLPAGLETTVGERGVRLSGGQKQRLSIARVFLKNPAIIIFDEATSALDNESEKAVQGSLEQLAHNRTTLVIAHRLSTIRNAQRILVLSDTGIAEQGTHAELLAANGVYAHLYHTQSKI